MKVVNNSAKPTEGCVPIANNIPTNAKGYPSIGFLRLPTAKPKDIYRQHTDAKNHTGRLDNICN